MANSQVTIFFSVVRNKSPSPAHMQRDGIIHRNEQASLEDFCEVT